MRVIKFRAWDELYGKMMLSGKLSEFFHAIEQRPEEQRPPVMFWTGLLDKTGREIFDGDIVRVDCSDGGEQWTEHFQVQYLEEFASFYVYSGGEIPPCPIMEIGNDLMEVVGNIYENFDLLESQ